MFGNTRLVVSSDYASQWLQSFIRSWCLATVSITLLMLTPLSALACTFLVYIILLSDYYSPLLSVLLACVGWTNCSAGLVLVVVYFDMEDTMD